MRRLFGSLMLAMLLTLAMAGSALAHVHGITPLRCLGVTLDGANRVNTTPASATEGGPISGLIPTVVGSAPLSIGDGGFDTPACPAP